MAQIKFAPGTNVSLIGKTIFSASLDGGGGEGGADIFWSGWSTAPQFTDSPSGTVTSDGISNLEISDRTALISFNFNYQGPTNVGGTVDASGCINLQDLRFYSAGITNIDVSGCTKLLTLSLDANQLTGAIDLSGLTSLNTAYLDYAGNNITSLDISDTALFFLNIPGLPNLTTITLNNVATLNFVYTFNLGNPLDTASLSIATKEALLASCVAAYNSGNAGYGYIDFVGDSSLLSPQAQADFQTLQNAGWMAV